MPVTTGTAPLMWEGTLAERPTPEEAPSCLYFANDFEGGTLFFSTGTTWKKLSPGLNSLLGGGGISTPELGGASSVILHHPHMAASAIATNLALNTFNAVSDPAFRQIVDLRNFTKLRIQGRLGGTVVAATKLRIQYHLGGNPAVATADAGWVTLAESAGSHTANAMFYTTELNVPLLAQVNNCLIRCGIASGDGVADPTITCCILNFY